MGAVDNYFDNCVHMEVDIVALERLMEPENEEASSKVHSEVLDERRR